MAIYSMLKNLILVFCFGGLGSVCRYVFGLILPTKPLNWGVLLSNFLGCLIVGFVLQLFVNRQLNEATKLMIAIGFCGGFTTFSSFSADVVDLFTQQKWLLAFGYLIVSVCIGLLGVLVGMYLGGNNSFYKIG